MSTEANNNRLALLLIAGVPVIVILASTWLWYYVASGRLDIVSVLGTANQGVLLQPPLAMETLQLNDGLGQPFEPIGEQPLWRLLLVGGADCDEACLQTAHYTRQIHTAMGKYRNRIERAMVLGEEAGNRLAQDYPKLKLLYTSPSGLAALNSAVPGGPPPAYFVVDPNGWIILAYTADADGKDVMADLKFLLKNSN